MTAYLSRHLSSDKQISVWEFFQLLQDLARCISPDLLAEAEQLRSAAEAATEKANANVSDRIHKFLETVQFRQDMLQALAMEDGG
ncbi:MAG: hypothetical protein HC772_07035 [Leptolyngbyaceae cyanobacterium CRU_2_3]|nr:hypothetical protein [Leptolyngbyaceae cyanobacterium CRU_2_3]